MFTEPYLIGWFARLGPWKFEFFSLVWWLCMSANLKKTTCSQCCWKIFYLHSFKGSRIDPITFTTVVHDLIGLAFSHKFDTLEEVGCKLCSNPFQKLSKNLHKVFGMNCLWKKWHWEHDSNNDEIAGFEAAPCQVENIHWIV